MKNNLFMTSAFACYYWAFSARRGWFVTLLDLKHFIQNPRNLFSWFKPILGLCKLMTFWYLKVCKGVVWSNTYLSSFSLCMMRIFAYLFWFHFPCWSCALRRNNNRIPFDSINPWKWTFGNWMCKSSSNYN